MIAACSGIESCLTVIDTFLSPNVNDTNEHGDTLLTKI